MRRFATISVLILLFVSCAFAEDTQNTLIVQGIRLHDQKEYQQAADIFTQAIALDPKSAQAAVAYLKRGSCYYNQKKYSEAVKDYTFSLRISPHPKAYYGRGVAYSALKNNGKALEDLQKALELDPRCADGDAHLSIGNIYYQLKDLGLAISNYSRGLAINPKNHRLYYNRASSYAEVGNYEAARKDFQKAAEFATNEQDRGFAKKKLQALPRESAGVAETQQAVSQTSQRTEGVYPASLKMKQELERAKNELKALIPGFEVVKLQVAGQLPDEARAGVEQMLESSLELVRVLEDFLKISIENVPPDNEIFLKVQTMTQQTEDAVRMNKDVVAKLNIVLTEKSRPLPDKGQAFTIAQERAKLQNAWAQSLLKAMDMISGKTQGFPEVLIGLSANIAEETQKLLQGQNQPIAYAESMKNLSKAAAALNSIVDLIWQPQLSEKEIQNIKNTLSLSEAHVQQAKKNFSADKDMREVSEAMAREIGFLQAIWSMRN
ncbi:MAG: tetratricopeptide repeat protein [Candidatus Omnitrophica bacterium]|nr:tetratricopeptide repeat protein [Candidatus Omnitrophota bacterium]